MSDAAFTLDDLKRIRRAMAAGVRSVTFSDRTTVYASMEDLERAERRIVEYLAGRRRSQMRPVIPERG